MELIAFCARSEVGCRGRVIDVLLWYTGGDGRTRGAKEGERVHLLLLLSHINLLLDLELVQLLLLLSLLYKVLVLCK
jgi:hypothetical protein